MSWKLTVDEVVELRKQVGIEDKGNLLQTCKECVQEHVDQIKHSQLFSRGYLDIQEIKEHHDGFSVEVIASPFLSKIIDAMDQGLWVNLKTGEPDFVKTEEVWQRHLDSKAFSDEVFEMVSRNRSPELRKIRGEILMFKLTAVKAKDKWIPNES